jgi:hypothetical protein
MRMRWAVYVACMEMRNIHESLVRRPEGKGLTERTKKRINEKIM